MSINGITNQNDYTKPPQSQSKIAKQNAVKNTAVPANVEQPQAEEPAVTLTISKSAAQAKMPISDEVLKSRQAVRDSMRDFDINDAFKSGTPNTKSIEENQKMAARFPGIQAKMLSGKRLSADEKSYLRKNYPEMHTTAMRVEQEVRRLKQDARRCKTKDDLNKLVTERKTQFMAAGSDSSLSLFMLPALDDASRTLTAN
ncbi:hypothetical protein LJB83_00715 [Clostridia bacterium OttesenSCG-928-F22]|nr:hypothetical protein [Clostridia bacterium OttesenSCG-928-F22]